MGFSKGNTVQWILGDCRPALPKGRKYQIVKTQIESHGWRPVVLKTKTKQDIQSMLVFHIFACISFPQYFLFAEHYILHNTKGRHSWQGTQGLDLACILQNRKRHAKGWP